MRSDNSINYSVMEVEYDQQVNPGQRFTHAPPSSALRRPSNAGGLAIKKFTSEEYHANT